MKNCYLRSATGAERVRHGPFRRRKQHSVMQAVRANLALLACGLTLWLSPLSVARAAELWFGANDPVVVRDRGRTTPTDYMDLFQPNAPWAAVASKVKVFVVSQPLLRRGTDEQIASVIRGLKQRNIALAFDGEILLGTHGTCGQAVNSYSDRGSMDQVGARLRRLGGDLRYMAMDNPLWFGHVYSGPNACRDSIDELAGIVAGQIQRLRRWFPNVQVGDIVPINRRTGPEWISKIAQWMAAYQKATGRPLAFLHADLVWQADWTPQMEALRARLRAAGIPFGVIVNGDARDPTDLAWTTHALERYRSVMANPATVPDQIIVQSWYARPTRLLPEDQPGTLTNVALQILRR